MRRVHEVLDLAVGARVLVRGDEYVGERARLVLIVDVDGVGALGEDGHVVVDVLDLDGEEAVAAATHRALVLGDEHDVERVRAVLGIVVVEQLHVLDDADETVLCAWKRCVADAERVLWRVVGELGREELKLCVLAMHVSFLGGHLDLEVAVLVHLERLRAIVNSL